MEGIIRFPQVIDIFTQYVVTATNLPTTETIAIKCVDADVLNTVVAEVAANTQLTLYIKYTKGAGETGCKIRFYDSYKGDPGALNSGDWYQETIESDTLGVATLYPFEIDLTASFQGSYAIPIGAIRAFAVTVQSYGGAPPVGAITLTLAARTN